MGLFLASGAVAMAQGNGDKPAQTDKAAKKLDLSTPHKYPGESGKFGGGERASAHTPAELGAMNVGGNGKIRLDGSRKSKDVVQEATGFDQTPGSTTFRSLAPASKSGTPPYVGFTLTTPTN